MTVLTVPQAAPELKLESSRRDYDPETDTASITLSWTEPDFLPVPCSGYRILLDDGHAGEFQQAYAGPSNQMTATLKGLSLDLFYRMKLQATTDQGNGPFTPLSYLRCGSDSHFDYNSDCYDSSS